VLHGVEAGREAAGSGSERVDRIEQARAESHRRHGRDGLLHEQRQARTHQRRGRHEQHEGEHQLSRQSPARQDGEEHLLDGGQESVQRERVESNPDLAGAKPAERLSDVPQIAGSEVAPAAEARHEGGEESAHREGRRAEDPGQHPDPEHLVDETGGAGEEEEQKDQKEDPDARASDRTSI
jgi:hypothetical protein